MDNAGAISTIAQISATLLGFSGLITVFEPRPVHEWTRVDKLRLKFLIGSSALPLVISLFAVVLLATGVQLPSVAAILSVVGILVLGFWTVKGIIAVWKIPIIELDNANWSQPLFWILQSIMILLLMAQVHNVVFAQALWAPLALLAAQLGASIMQFIRLIVSRTF